MFSDSHSLIRDCQDYINSGFTIFPLTKLSKIPAKESVGWTKFEGKNLFQQQNFKDKNVALLLGTSHQDGYLSVIDIDVYSDKSELYLQSIIEQFNIEYPVYQTTASGGYHIFIKTDELLKRKDVKIHGGHIELRADKNFVVLAPSIVKSDKTGKMGQYILTGSLNDIPVIDSNLVQIIF